MLADLMKGNASVSLLDCPANGQVTLDGLDFEDADQIFTLENTLTITEGEPTQENTRIDQMKEIIDSMITEGDYTIAAQIPSCATALYDRFYNAGADVSTTGITGPDGTVYKGKAYGDKKEVYCSVHVVSQSKQTAVTFARVRCTISRPNMDNTDSPGYASFYGYIVANLKEGEGNFVIGKAQSGA